MGHAKCANVTQRYAILLVPSYWTTLSSLTTKLCKYLLRACTILACGLRTWALTVRPPYSAVRITPPNIPSEHSTRKYLFVFRRQTHMLPAHWIRLAELLRSTYCTVCDCNSRHEPGECMAHLVLFTGGKPVFCRLSFRLHPSKINPNPP